MAVAQTLPGQSLSKSLLTPPQICLCHLPDTLPLCGCGEGASGVSVCVHPQVCEGCGPLGGPWQASGVQAWSVCVPICPCMCSPSCLCESLLPLPDLISLISRPFLAVLHTLSLSRGPPGEPGSPAQAWIGTTTQLGNRLRCVRTCSGSQSQVAARLGLKPQPRGCPTSTNFSLPLCLSCLHRDPWGQRLGWEQAGCPPLPRPCSATCLVCFPLLLPRECETPMSEGLARCLPHTCPPRPVSRRGEATRLGELLSSDIRASLCVWLPDLLPKCRMCW